MEPTYSLTRSDNGTNQRWILAEGDTHLGRDSVCGIVLDEASVSRDHAVLRIHASKIEIEDMGSRNGSWLNGQPIAEPTLVQPGDEIQLGHVVLKFRKQPEEGYLGTGPDKSSDMFATRFEWGELSSEIQSFGTENEDFWRAVMDAAQLMVLPQPTENLYPAMLDLLERIAPADRILLLLRNEKTDTLEIAASRPLVAAAEGLPLSQTLVNVVIENRESVLVQDVHSDPAFAAAQSVADLNLDSAMAAPLFDNERVIGLVYAHTQGLAQKFTQRQLGAFTMLANLIAIKLTNARLLEDHRDKLRLEQEMAAAGEIQQRILPTDLPEIPGYERFAQLTPCLQMAGDFYDVRSLPDGSVVLIVGDVSGKGSGAALLMSHILAAFRVLVAENIPLATVGQRLNENLFEASDPTHYVTLWMARLDPKTHRMTYMNAGHNPPLLKTAEGAWNPLTRTALPIGMLPDGVFGTEEIAMELGSLLCVYTDGLAEAQLDHEFFGEEGIQASLDRPGTNPLPELAQGLFGDVREFQRSESFEDDCTVLLLRRLE